MISKDPESWFVSNWSIPDIRARILKNNLNVSFPHGVKFGDIEIFLNGYIVPRDSIYTLYKKTNPEKLIHDLYKSKGINFVQFLKGIFIIVIIDQDQVHIFNDHNSLKRFFIWQDKGSFIITDNLKIITDNVKPEIDRENLILFCLMEHFVLGETLFKNVNYSLPATYIRVGKEITYSNYWTPQMLFGNKNNNETIGFFAGKWRQLLEQYIEYLHPRLVSITLTGGNDSRMVLSALLNINTLFRTFTYGNPQSSDGVISQQLAERMGLQYECYYNQNATCSWFLSLVNKIDTIGQSLINIHRAHRLDAIIKEKESGPEVDMLITGLMGGEYLKGISYDDYIIPKLFRLIEKDKSKDLSIVVKRLLLEKKIKIDSVDFPRIIEKVRSIIARLNGNKKEREFLYAFYIYGSAHHYQDSQIFQSQVKYLVNPFMDIDFLELISHSSYLSVNNDDSLFLGKLYSSKFQVGITDSLAPQLSDIPYAKKGQYTASDFLGNPIVFMIRRVFRNRRKNTFPSNFPYDIWFKTFCLVEFEKIHPLIDEIFQVQDLVETVKELTNNSNEKDLHLISNPINLNRILTYYEKD